jgi:hypothetical protein
MSLLRRGLLPGQRRTKEEDVIRLMLAALIGTGLANPGGCNCGGNTGSDGGNEPDAGALPVINSFTATPATLPDAGGSVTLNWMVTGATQLSIDHGIGSVTPVTSGMEAVDNVTSSTTWTLTATNAVGSSTASTTACVEGNVSLAISTPTSYVCNAPFTATYSITNMSCAPVTVQSLQISASITSGPCGPSSPGNYTPTHPDVPVGETVAVFDLMSGPFCCGAPGCAATMNCTEAFTFTAMTSAGTLTSTASAMIDLSGCNVTCH